VALIASSGVMLSIIALVVSIAAFQRQIDASTKAALCQVWEYSIPQPGEPQPTTARGRAQADKALVEARKLRCPGR
jgi:hypothetical protein